MAADMSPRIWGLEALLKAQAGKGRPPLEAWNPPYCGDVGLAIRADGVWEYRGSPIGRASLVKLFASVLWKDADGRHYLVTPAEKVDVAVADAPFLAVEMELRAPGRAQELIFRTNVDDIVTVDAEHPLRFEVDQGNGGVKPYLGVRGRLEALVTRPLAWDLAELALAGAAAAAMRPGVWSRGAFFALPLTGDEPVP
jgi:uncharacterized protein